MKPLILLVTILFLSGCALVTRLDEDQFDSIQSGQINSSKVPAFVDCLMDGFGKLNIALTTAVPKQTQRANGFRVETYVDNKLLIMSADVFYDGKVELFEQKNSHSLFSVWSTEGEKTAFDQCLKKYK